MARKAPRSGLPFGGLSPPVLAKWVASPRLYLRASGSVCPRGL